jgi:hypothetical protein
LVDSPLGFKRAISADNSTLFMCTQFKSLSTHSWDRCYDFKNIFAEKNCEKIGVFDSKQS